MRLMSKSPRSPGEKEGEKRKERRRRIWRSGKKNPYQVEKNLTIFLRAHADTTVYSESLPSNWMNYRLLFPSNSEKA